MLLKKSKKSTLIFLILTGWLFLYNVGYAQSLWTKDYSVAENMVWEKRLADNVGFLTDSICQGRATGTKGNVEVSAWIRRQFEDAHLLKFSDTYIKRFYAGRGLLGRNVIGMMPGSVKEPRDKYVVVGAHFDHLGTINGTMYPGADSNASGITALIAIADMFSAMKLMGKSYNSNIIFIAFDGHGMDLAGSRDFWRMLEDGELTDPLSGKVITPEKIELMVNIDQIGSSLSPLRSKREDYIIMLGTHSLRPIKREMLDFCNKFYRLNLDIDLTYYGSRNFTDVFYKLSDQRVFVENRKPAVLFTSGITMNTNKTRDKAASLNYPVLKKRIYLMFHWIEKML